MTSARMQQMVRPFYPVLKHAFGTGWGSGMAAIAIMRAVRKGERATVLHATLRESLRDLCDLCDPFLTMAEEPEGKGLDVMRLTLDDETLALRWGRYDQAKQRINRNDSKRTYDACGQQLLFGENLDPAGLPTATVSYQVDDDEILGGVPQWWMSRIALRRERDDTTEFIEEIAAFESPVRFGDLPDPRTPEYIVTQQNRHDVIEQMVEQLRSELG